MKKLLIIFCLFQCNIIIFCQNNRHIDKGLYQYIPADIYIYIKDTLNSDTVYQVVFVNNQITEICIKYSNIKNNKFIYQRDSCNYEIGRFKKISNKKFLKLPENYIIVDKVGKWIYSFDCEVIINYHTRWSFINTKKK